MKKHTVKYALLFLLTIASLSSCLSTKSLTEIVKNKILQDNNAVIQIDTSYLKLSTDRLQKTDSLVLADKIKSYFIPAILFWSKNNTLGCTINNTYFTDIFSNKLTELSEEFRIKEILNGRRLEISLESVPNRFIYTNRFNFMFLLYVYSYSYQESIYPENGEFNLTYKVLEENKVVKSGNFNINNTVKPLSNSFKSQSKFIETYIDELKLNFEQQSNQIIIKIINEIG